MKRLNMKKLRVEHDLTIKELAERLQTTPNNLSMIERGTRNGGYTFWVNFQKQFNIPNKDMWDIIKKGE